MDGLGGLKSGYTSADVQAALVGTEAQEMETWVEAYRTRVDINTEILIGPPFLQIIRQVMRNGHDLVSNFPRIRLGWIVYSAETILNQIDCSVLAIKPPGSVSPVSLLD